MTTDPGQGKGPWAKMVLPLSGTTKHEKKAKMKLFGDSVMILMRCNGTPAHQNALAGCFFGDPFEQLIPSGSSIACSKYGESVHACDICI